MRYLTVCFRPLFTRSCFASKQMKGFQVIPKAFKISTTGSTTFVHFTSTKIPKNTNKTGLSMACFSNVYLLKKLPEKEYPIKSTQR